MRPGKGIAVLTAEHMFRPRRKGFFAPVFSFFPAMMGSLRTFRLWPGGANAVGPVNSASSYGGIVMTPELALTLSSVWACIWRYANTISTLPLMTMETGPQNTATVAPKHPLYYILHDRPNINMSSASFWKGMIASMMSWGFCISKKLYSGSRLVGLDPWRPEFTTTYMGPNGQLRYRYSPNAGPGNPMGENQDVSWEEVFVVVDRTMDGYTPLSRIQYGATSMGQAISAERAATLAWKNGFRASGILTIAQWLKPDQRDAYKRIVNEFVGTGVGDGTDKQFGVMVAENATKFEQLNLKPQDLELLSSRRFSVEDICRWYDMPPILIGHSAEGQTMWGSGIEQIILGWQKLSLAPICRTIEQEIWRQVLTNEDRVGGIFCEFNLDALMRGDSAARSTFYSQMSQNGIMTRNEIRAKENLPPKEGGDQLTCQSNLVPLDRLGEQQAAAASVVKEQLRQFLGIEERGTIPGQREGSLQ